MIRIFTRRFINYFKENKFLFSALLILVTAVVTIVLSLECTAYTVLDGRYSSAEYENIEDGQFTTQLPLSDDVISELSEEHDVQIQKQFSIDLESKDITYRVFSDRESIDKLSLLEGHAPSKSNEIAIDQLFAKKHSLSIDDTIILNEDTYRITGIGSIPDYAHPTKHRTDVGIAVETFTWAIVAEMDFDYLKNENPANAVEYTYSYTKGDADELKFSEDIENCLAFIPRDDNRRMDVELRYAKLYKTVGYVIGFVLIAMLALIFAVVTKNQIHNEHLEIGALYALGVSKNSIMLFYIFPTLIVTIAAGFLGICIGFMPKIVGVAIEAFHRTNSFPYYDLSKPAVLYVYAIIIPPLISTLVNYISLNKILSSSALSLMRDNYAKTKTNRSSIRLKHFISNFQMHRVLEDKSSILVFFSVLVSIMIFMLGLNTHYMTTNNMQIARDGITCNYISTMKYPVQDLDTQGEQIILQDVKAEKYGTNISFSVVGIIEDSRFYDFSLDLEEGEAIAGEALATKFRLRIGDEFVFTEGVGKTEHKLKIADIVQTDARLELYMNISEARKEFCKDEDYYTALLFDDEPDIDEKIIYSTTTTEEILDSFDIMEDTMLPFRRLTYISSILIFVSTMYLIVSTMIDRSSSGISLTKVFGFTGFEIQRMYVNPMVYSVFVALIFAIPAGKLVCDLVCPAIFKDLYMGMFFSFPWQTYVLMLLGTMFVLAVVLLLLLIKLSRISVNDILKNRE